MKKRRHRHGHYKLASTTSPFVRVGRKLVTLGLLLFGLFILGNWILNLFGVGNPVRRTAVALTVEERGIVRVSLKGEQLKRVENDLKLYPDDRITTGGNAHASLSFLDETWARLGEDSDVTIKESTQGAEASKWSIHLTDGSLWLAVPTLETFSGSIVRKVVTPRMSFSFPSRTEAVITPASIVVFAADGLGVTVSVAGSNAPLVIGEGQQLILPDGASTSGNLYRYRSPLDPMAVRSTLVEESRTLYAQYASTATDVIDVAPIVDERILVVTRPEDGMTVATSTITVEGRAGNDVAFIRVNGYETTINEETRTFHQELALPDEDEVRIHVEALAKDNTVLSEVQRTIMRDREPPHSPTIKYPAKEGQTYQTNRTSIEISGPPSPGTVGIIVNDYRLQLFTPDDNEWKYLASTKLDNLKPGKNVYEVVAINQGGYKSEPAVITIILGDGPEGVISEEEAETAEDTTTTFLQNDPLEPGSLRVVSPTAGTEHTTMEKEFVIEGVTSQNSNSVWVNNYRLQLYKSGKTIWNYIASTELRTMKRGRNAYEIVSRNKNGQVLDKFTYTVYFRPRRGVGN